jgi:hypothetical protein
VQEIGDQRPPFWPLGLVQGIGGATYTSARRVDIVAFDVDGRTVWKKEGSDASRVIFGVCVESYLVRCGLVKKADSQLLSSLGGGGITEQPQARNTSFQPHRSSS